MNPLWIAAAVGIALAIALNSAFASDGGSTAGGLFVMQGKTRFWAPGQAGKLVQFLGSATVAPHGQVERVWVFSPSGAAGGVNALGLVRKIQKAGNVATTSTNLFDAGDMRMLAEVLGSEFLALDTQSTVGKGVGQAVLPVL